MSDIDSIDTSVEDESLIEDFDFKRIQTFWERNGLPKRAFISVGKLMWMSSKVEKMMSDLYAGENVGIPDHLWTYTDITPTTFESSDRSSDVDSEVTDDDYMMRSVSTVCIDEVNEMEVRRKVSFSVDTVDTDTEIEDYIGIAVFSGFNCSPADESVKPVTLQAVHQDGVDMSYETIKPRRGFNSFNMCVAVCVCLPIAVSCGVMINVLAKCFD